MIMKDPYTGNFNSMFLDITTEQMDSWHNGGLIQDVMPNLTASEREFVRYGTAPESWDTFIGDVDDNNNIKEHYSSYFEDDPIAWHVLGVTHNQLLGFSRLFEEGSDSLMTDSQLGAKIRKIKEKDAIECGLDEWVYKPSYTAKEIGYEWRTNYQDSWFELLHQLSA